MLKTIVHIVDGIVIIFSLLAMIFSIIAHNYYALVSWAAATGMYLKLIGLT